MKHDDYWLKRAEAHCNAGMSEHLVFCNLFWYFFYLTDKE